LFSSRLIEERRLVVDARLVDVDGAGEDLPHRGQQARMARQALEHRARTVDGKDRAHLPAAGLDDHLGRRAAGELLAQARRFLAQRLRFGLVEERIERQEAGAIEGIELLVGERAAAARGPVEHRILAREDLRLPADARGIRVLALHPAAPSLGGG
jgi:hypothetical protein